MTSSVRFTRGIASLDWAYRRGQVVRVGSVWSQTEIPEEAAATFLKTGQVVAVEEEAAPVEVAAVAPSAEFAAMPKVSKKKRGA
jgi:hypothetical protein